MLNAGPTKSPQPRDRAKTFLQEILADGPVKSEDVTKSAKQNQISHRTLERAADDLKVETHVETVGGPWFWCLKGAWKASRDRHFSHSGGSGGHGSGGLGDVADMLTTDLIGPAAKANLDEYLHPGGNPRPPRTPVTKLRPRRTPV